MGVHELHWKRSSPVHELPPRWSSAKLLIPKPDLTYAADLFGGSAQRMVASGSSAARALWHPMKHALSRPLRLHLAGRPLPTIEGRPLIFAHRGASLEAPENTMAAFRIALQYDVDGIELDVRRCASGEIVVFHDEDCMRMCGSPLKIAEATLDELRALELPPFLGIPQRIPTLEEV